MFRRFRPAHQRPLAPRGHVVEDMLRSLALIVQPEALRSAMAIRLREFVGCERVVFCAWRADENAMVAEFGTDRTQDVHGVRFERDGTLCRWLLVNNEPLLMPDPTGVFQYLDPSEQSRLTAINARACVPLITGDRLLAILVLTSADPSWRLHRDDLLLLSQVSQQAGLALENAEMHCLERERLKSVHQSEQLAVAGLLAATVAHEVRNPLTAIRSTIQYVLDSTAELSAKRQLLDEVLVAVDRIEHIVGGLLALSRPQSGNLIAVDLAEVCEQSLLLLQAYARTNGIVIERVVEPGPVRVFGDARELNQVCTNLLLNASQAMPGGGRLTLRCGVVLDDSHRRLNAVLQVRDTGCGIPEEHLSRVFEPFFTTKRAGTGLGLSLCKEIVTRHEGSLRLDSAPGQGTLATVLLPLLQS